MISIDMFTKKNNELVNYRMARVIYGVISSPFISMQVLRKLAQDNRDDSTLLRQLS